MVLLLSGMKMDAKMLIANMPTIINSETVVLMLMCQM